MDDHLQISLILHAATLRLSPCQFDIVRLEQESRLSEPSTPCNRSMSQSTLLLGKLELIRDSVLMLEPPARFFRFARKLR